MNELEYPVARAAVLAGFDALAELAAEVSTEGAAEADGALFAAVPA